MLTLGTDKSFRPIQAYSDKCEQKYEGQNCRRREFEMFCIWLMIIVIFSGRHRAVAYLFLFSFLTFWLIADCQDFLGGFILLTLLYLVNEDLNNHHSYYGRKALEIRRLNLKYV